MSNGFQSIVMLGNSCKDAELRYTQDGKPVCSFSIAVNEPYKTASGEKKENVLFMNVTVWGKFAEICAEHVKKGMPLLVQGRLKESKWIDKENIKRSKIELIANTVKFLGKPAGKGEPTDDEKKNQPESEQGNEFPLDENGEAMPNF